MTEYNFVTVWVVDAPIDQVWEKIFHYEQWPNWWKYVESVNISDEKATEKPSNLTWKTPLSYKLAFKTKLTKIEPPHILELVAKGDVDGIGLWQLEALEKGTLVRYFWNVKITKFWMNTLAILILPLMEWNHNVIMQEGGEALARVLGVKLLFSAAEDKDKSEIDLIINK